MIKNLKNNFHRYNEPFNLDYLYDLDDNTVKTSEKVDYSKDNYRYFISYSDDDDDIYPLCNALLQTTAYVKLTMMKLKWINYFHRWRTFKIS